LEQNSDKIICKNGYQEVYVLQVPIYPYTAEIMTKGIQIR